MNKPSYIVFTDGSAINMRHAATHPELVSGSYAYIISEFSVDNKGYFDIRDKYRYGSGYMNGIMSPRAELLAIYHVLNKLRMRIKMSGVDSSNIEVLLVSDSLNSVLTYNEWIWKWTIDPEERDNVRKGTKVVKNSDIIHDTYYLLQELIGKMKMRVELVHLNSHISKKYLVSTYHKFMARSSLSISYELFNDIVLRNIMTDVLAAEPMETIYDTWNNDVVEQKEELQ